MTTYTVTRDGKTLATYATYTEAFQDLHNRQGQSIYWAIKYEGYNIIEQDKENEYDYDEEEDWDNPTHTRCLSCDDYDAPIIDGIAHDYCWSCAKDLQQTEKEDNQ